MSDISVNNTNVDENTQENENIGKIIDWINDNRESCPGGVCPVEYDEDGDVIMTSPHSGVDSNPDTMENNNTSNEETPNTSNNEADDEGDTPVEESEECAGNCDNCDCGENNEEDIVPGECGGCGQSASEGEEEPCVYVVMRDDRPIAYHRSESVARSYMMERVNSATVAYMDIYNVCRDSKDDGSVVITGVFKNSLFRWTTHNLTTFNVVEVPMAM